MYESKAIIKSLKNELSLQKRHVKLLQAQNAALIACDRARFFQIFEGYSTFLAELERHAAERNAALDGESLIEATVEWPDSELELARKLSGEIKIAIVSAREISTQNQKLIARELTYIDFLLNLYVEAGRRSASYAGSGDFAPAIGNRLINQIA